MAVASRELITRSMAACRRRFEALGFKKRKEEVYTKEIADDILGWIGLNRAVHWGEGQLAVNPVVGVRWQAIERLVAELESCKFHSYVPPTISLPLSCLVPQQPFGMWIFTPDGDVEQVAQQMVAAVSDYGLPFMREHTSLAALHDKLGPRGYGFPHQLPYRRPVAAWLMGDVRLAEEELREELDLLGSRQDGAAKAYREYARALEARLREVSEKSEQKG